MLLGLPPAEPRHRTRRLRAKRVWPSPRSRWIVTYAGGVPPSSRLGDRRGRGRPGHSRRAGDAETRFLQRDPPRAAAAAASALQPLWKGARMYSTAGGRTSRWKTRCSFLLQGSLLTSPQQLDRGGSSRLGAAGGALGSASGWAAKQTETLGGSWRVVRRIWNGRRRAQTLPSLVARSGSGD